MKTMKFARPSDFHTHLRSPAQVGERCFRFLVRMNCAHYRYVVVEPNTYLRKNEPGHHIETVDDLVKYRNLVVSALPEVNFCEPLFLIKLTPKTTPSMIRDAADAGCIGVKLYPEGVTTGSSHGGVSDFHSKKLYRCLEYMQERGLVFQQHPEMPHTFCLERENIYHSVLEKHARAFPRLRIFVEHITDRRTLDMIHRLRQTYDAMVFGTITGHHLRFTLDNVLGQNQHHCWPCAKYPEDRTCLVEAATSGLNYVLSITDSAPWKWHMKHMRDCACAGVFNPAEVAIPWLVTRFGRRNLLTFLEHFWSYNGLAAYGLDSEDMITIVRRPWVVPRRYDTGSGTITPFLAGETLEWQVKS